jgi:hypothetical protein
MAHQDELISTEPCAESDRLEDSGRSRSRVGVGILLFLFIFVHRGIQGQNDLSRFVAIDSLINRGTWQIDGSSWAQKRVTRDGRSYLLMNDIVLHPRGHFYSSKPPVLSFLGAGVLRVLQWLGGEFSFERPHDALPTFVLTWFLVGGLTAMAFHQMRSRAGALLPPMKADIATILTLGGTLFLTYSTTFNNHTVAAALVLLAFFSLGMHAGTKHPSTGAVLLAGLAMGFAAVIDMPVGGAFGLGMGLYIIFGMRAPRRLAVFGLAVLPGLLLHCWLQYSIWGSVLPVQVMSGLGSFEGNYWGDPVGADAWRISRWKYWALTLFSTRGLFTLSPILLLGAAGLADGLLKRRDEDRRRENRVKFAVLTVLFGILLNIWYYSFEGPTNFGGACFGFRWYIGFTPILSWYAISYFAGHRHDRGVRRIFYACGVTSLTFALIGMQNPWLLMEANSHPAVRVLLFLRGF